MALALYRRYRPDTFDGVIGQDQVTIPLMRALDENKLTHAYLFSGPRGCGKTSSARILARCVNCAKGPTSHPCGECESCKDLATGGPGSIDVVEIDAASHNGVDDARELRERAGFAPARDRYKIFILDEAHMVTPQGFNALLKIVEEPPEHVMFIFATTEPDKVIGTIRSRTHHYPFRLVPQEVMGPYLEQICEDEHIEAEPGVLRLAMRAGGGSVRDTLSVLDQLMVGAVDGSIAYDSAVALLGFTPDALIGEAVDAVADKNGEALYGVIQKVVVGGFDPRRFVEDLLARVRDLLVLTLGGERAESVLSDDAAAENMDDLRRQASALGLSALTQMADTINATLANMTGAISPRMRLELLAARLLAGREEGMAVVASSSGVPDFAGDAGTSAAAESSRGSMAGSRRSAARHAAGNVRAQDSAPVIDTPSAPVQPSVAPTNPADAVASGVASVLADVQQAMNATTSVASAAPAATSVPAPIHDDRTPDQKWDALVAALPEDVQRYVSREKVPRVLLSGDRLWIKFDKALSKYAFAKAVAKESVDGNTEVVKIVRAEVHKAFGPSVTLAPAKKLADGSESVPWSKLSPEEQSKINAQLVQEQLKAATLLTANLGTAAGLESSGKEPAGTSAKSAEDGGNAGDSGDEEGHRAAAGGAEEVDPWAAPTQEVHHPERPVPDDDPWVASAQPMQPQSVVASGVNDVKAPEQHAKHVAVPDVSDNVDPWAAPMPVPQQAPVDDDPWGNPMPIQAGPVDPMPAPTEPEVAPKHANHQHRAPRQDAAPQQGQPNADPWSQQFSAPAQPMPQVAAEDDEYSMSDESIGASTALSVDDLTRLFEVKKVEDFGPDDAKNPRNMQQKKNLDD
ncbi:DNA polymerase III subunit gamma/tau [Bifidobacterium pseudocatenulatum]|jgi:DNA polymerase-3 subunit gamma/tau|uniref:DNA polymerase III subunit gamma/tau n=1 Tax=Bifidobacterium pseudocatenulatum TaxID=28026 RepID=UPI0009B9F0E6|nr:DNA polymerase III subunit gamma/tau [Bifidobacterium pseudocatenulatum]MCB4870558.1 DNA polymerase III subunit gamma/tau [Bifidobacterium pseudocatenulatum]MCG4621108.1 DNA polymerase III subunit gamma/tau [Bifidobacterium pseudocatenulatum]MCG4624134.1 DNA polymerase III subunit gamma/tau [Bifidobacterium pseudocatenulatum]MCG4628044.1 DNA polymerase III subunit gamma/tau [Bifidobacterium pseudocatenulatum]MCG4631190.1 DNA polymerase III subunit gamma/tau [Bifidobacterium pseudocatenulatu